MFAFCDIFIIELERRTLGWSNVLNWPTNKSITFLRNDLALFHSLSPSIYYSTMLFGWTLRMLFVNSQSGISIIRGQPKLKSNSHLIHRYGNLASRFRATTNVRNIWIETWTVHCDVQTVLLFTSLTNIEIQTYRTAKTLDQNHLISLNNQSCFWFELKLTHFMTRYQAKDR